MMKKIGKFILLFVCSVILTSQSLFPIGVKIVNLPDEIKVEENVFKESFIRNLSELEIYEYFLLDVIDDAIYISNFNPPEIVKLSLQGKLMGRFGRKGQGPGEFVRIDGIGKYNGNIAVLDNSKRVLIFYTKEPKYIRELRLKKSHMGFLVDKKNNFVFFGACDGDFYFDKYSKDIVHIGNFGHCESSKSERKKKKLFDDVRRALYVPEDNGIWASFKNRYDIRYYKNQELAVEIKAKKGFFKTTEENYGGRIVKICKNSRALCLAKYENRLFYFFRNNGIAYCDIFDLLSFKLIRRIALERHYRQVSHFKDNIFYSLCRDDSEDDVLLFKLEL